MPPAPRRISTSVGPSAAGGASSRRRSFAPWILQVRDMAISLLRSGGFAASALARGGGGFCRGAGGRPVRGEAVVRIREVGGHRCTRSLGRVARDRIDDRVVF